MKKYHRLLGLGAFILVFSLLSLTQVFFYYGVRDPYVLAIMMLFGAFFGVLGAMQYYFSVDLEEIERGQQPPMFPARAVLPSSRFIRILLIFITIYIVASVMVVTSGLFVVADKIG